MKKLFASGDSFTDPNFVSSKYGTAITKAWPSVLAECLGDDWDVFNAGYSAHNNDYIVSSLYRYVANNGKPDCVAICWTNSGRLTLANDPQFGGSAERAHTKKRFHYDPVGWHKMAKTVDSVAKDPTFDKAMTDFGEFYSKRWYPTHYMGMAVENFLTNVYIIQDYCQTHNIPFVFISGINICSILKESRATGMKVLMKTLIESDMFNNIDDDNFVGWPLFEPFGGFTVHDIVKWETSKDKYCMGERDHHPNDEGHKLIALMLYDRLRRNGYKYE